MLNAGPITAVAVSGGMDSLYALVSLQEKGECVFALHAVMLPPELAPPGYEGMLERLQQACDALNVPLVFVDCVDAFSAAVIDPFVRAYAAGTTPNPCAHCNAAIKFGLLLDKARNLGACKLATGHYIRLEETDNGMALYAGADVSKDQSYFLSLVPGERLAFAVSPLAWKSKSEIRVELEGRGITVPAPGESQEICFVPGDEYRAFLESRSAKIGVELPGPGPVVLPDGTRIGDHKGLWQYTEGQRKGLGIAWTEPLYVLEKDVAGNRLVAGTGEQLGGGVVRAKECNFLVPFEEWPEMVRIRTRFRQSARPARARFEGGGEGGVLVFEEEMGAGPYARGQIVAVYDGEGRVLAGGVID